MDATANDPFADAPAQTPWPGMRRGKLLESRVTPSGVLDIAAGPGWTPADSDCTLDDSYIASGPCRSSESVRAPSLAGEGKAVLSKRANGPGRVPERPSRAGRRVRRHGAGGVALRPYGLPRGRLWPRASSHCDALPLGERNHAAAAARPEEGAFGLPGKGTGESRRGLPRRRCRFPLHWALYSGSPAHATARPIGAQGGSASASRCRERLASAARPPKPRCVREEPLPCEMAASTGQKIRRATEFAAQTQGEAP